jgi:hypothetical protein
LQFIDADATVHSSRAARARTGEGQMNETQVIQRRAFRVMAGAALEQCDAPGSAEERLDAVRGFLGRVMEVTAELDDANAH